MNPEVAPMPRFFNTAGPVKPEDHYSLDSLVRVHFRELEGLIDQKKYFILHAPRQTGKTSALLALMKTMNEHGRFRAVYCNIEAAQAYRENVDQSMRAILGEVASRVRHHLGDPSLERALPEILAHSGTGGGLNALLTRWAEASDKPCILFVDEIDALIGDTLISVLRQLRSGYDKRPEAFPQSVILCGVRDVRDYRIHTGKGEIITGGSAFNIKAESLRLGNFTAEQIAELYKQHADETGQTFTPDAIDLAWRLTRGQPWLVNALAYEACFRMPEGRDRANPVTADLLVRAKENLILRRDTHLDQLVDKLREERLRRVVEPVLLGADTAADLKPDDVQYAVDLGLIRQEVNGETDIANEIYREVIPRELAWTIQEGMTSR